MDKKNIVPIVFAFDNNLVFPACVCLSSLMMSAKDTTFYDIIILCSASDGLNRREIDRVQEFYSNCRIQLIDVDDTIAGGYEVRGITTPTYFRLLIPELLPQYDKVLYSDVDVLFRRDLSELLEKELDKDYLAAVYDWSFVIDENGQKYIQNELHLNSNEYIQAGFLLINAKQMRKDGLVDRFKEEARKKYKFQDQDILNVVCVGKKVALAPWWNMTTYSFLYWNADSRLICRDCTEEELQKELFSSILHYNGQKPWNGFCLNYDIWWEYYRKSPFFSEKQYFNYYNKKKDELDSLSLWKRIKVLARFFIVGRLR